MTFIRERRNVCYIIKVNEAHYFIKFYNQVQQGL